MSVRSLSSVRRSLHRTATTAGLALMAGLALPAAGLAASPTTAATAEPPVVALHVGGPTVVPTPPAAFVAPKTTATVSSDQGTGGCAGVDGWYCRPAGSVSSVAGAGNTVISTTGASRASGASSGSVASGWWNTPVSQRAGATPAPTGTATTSSYMAAAGGTIQTGTATSQGSTSSTASTGTGSAAAVTAQEATLIRLMNAARAQAGEGPLVANPTLQALALKKAEDMVTLHYFGHDSPDLGLPAQMEAAAGYLAQAMGAEDMAEAGSVTDAFVLFRGSPTHWANIMDPVFTQVGVAVVPIPYGILVEVLFSGPIV